MPRYQLENDSTGQKVELVADTPFEIMDKAGVTAGLWWPRVMSERAATALSVPALAAGTISPASPTPTSTLSVTGYNGQGLSLYQWRANTGAGFADIAGATAATIDLTGRGYSAGAQILRRSSCGGQPPVDTPAVTLQAASALWTPDLLPGIGGWYAFNDPAQMTTINEGGVDKVTQVNDRSGQGRHMVVADGNSPPPLSITSPNGKAGAWIATGNAMIATGAAPNIVGSGPRFTMAAMGARGTSDRMFFSTGSPVGTAAMQRWTITHSGGNGRVEYDNGSSGSALSWDASGVMGVTHSGSSTAAGTSFMKDGVISASGDNDPINTGGGVSTPVWIAARSAADASDDCGPLFAMVWGSQALSTTNRQKLEGYLAHEFGFQDKLPVDHPHKASPPTT